MHTNPPDDVKYGRDEEFVIDGNCHVAWLVKGRGDSAHGEAQVDPPEQKEKLGYRETQCRMPSLIIDMFPKQPHNPFVMTSSSLF